jgi:flagellar hook-associated protein 2
MTSITNALVSQQITVMTFNGQSKYSSDFQQILSKAVNMDTIHLSQLDDTQNTNQSRLAALQGIDIALTSLQSSIKNLTTAIGPNALSASVGNPSLASVTLGAGAIPGTYQLEVDDLGSASQAVSSPSGTTVTDPNTQTIASGSGFQLSVSDPSVNGGATQTTAISSDGTLSGLVKSINATPGLGVTASIVNVGSQSSPDYRLALQANSLGAVNISLTSSSDPSTNLVSVTTGRNSSYKVDGTPISGTSDTLELAPGVNVNLLSASPGFSTSITVSQSTAQAQTALQSLANAYNAVVSALAAQHGQNAGALSGDSILQEIQQTLSSINGYRLGGSGLSNIGLDLNSTGQLSFNAAEFASGLGANFSSLSQFLGDSTSGFIGAATSALNSLEDPNTGIIKSAENRLNDNLTTIASQISDQIALVNQFQQNLYNQLSASDAAIFTLTNQESFFQNMFQTQNANLIGGL